MNVFHFLSLDVRTKSLVGLPDDWAPIFITRLTYHPYAQYCAIVAPKRDIPQTATPADLSEAFVILFSSQDSVLDACPSDRCHLNPTGGGSTTFDKGKITIVFSPSGGWFDAMRIDECDVLFSL